MNIHDVFSYGCIVFSDEDMGVLITVNGSYFNWWNDRGNGEWENATCRPTDCINGTGDITIANAFERAANWYKEELEASEAAE